MVGHVTPKPDDNDHEMLIRDSGGDLGWKEWGSLLSEFQIVAFELEPSSLKSPILGEAKTNQGYHIIMVQDRRKASKRK